MSTGLDCSRPPTEAWVPSQKWQRMTTNNFSMTDIATFTTNEEARKYIQVIRAVNFPERGRTVKDFDVTNYHFTMTYSRWTRWKYWKGKEFCIICTWIYKITSFLVHALYQHFQDYGCLTWFLRFWFVHLVRRTFLNIFMSILEYFSWARHVSFAFEPWPHFIKACTWGRTSVV